MRLRTPIHILQIWDKDGNELDPGTLEPINAAPGLIYQKPEDGLFVSVRPGA